MEEQLWSKTLLKSYSSLERIANSIDRAVCKVALGSRVTHSKDNALNSTYSVMEKLLELNERKILLVNTKVLVDRVLKNMEKNMAKYIVLKYIKGYTTERVAELTHTPTRTTSRKLSAGLEQFGKVLNSLGYNATKLHELYDYEPWIMNIYNKIRCDYAFYDMRTSIILNKKLVPQN